MSAPKSTPAALENLDALLAQHTAAIGALRTALGDGLPAGWDDVWLLRFVLSYAEDGARLEAALKCAAYRKAEAPLLALAAAGTPLPKAELIRTCLVADFHGTSLLGEPLFVVRAGLSAFALLFEHVTPTELLQYLMYGQEKAFLRCDALSRERRLLVKQIRVIDLAHVTLAMATATQFQRTLGVWREGCEGGAGSGCLLRDAASLLAADTTPRRSPFFPPPAGESSKMCEYIYPQLLGRAVMLNPPRFFYALFSLFRTFMSPRLLARLGVCPGPNSRAAAGASAAPSASACPFAGPRFDPAALPTFLGGTCRCVASGGCVAGVPNDCASPPAGGGGGETTPVVAAGSHHDVVLPVRVAGARLLWQLALADKGVSLSVEVQPEAGPPLVLLAPQKVKKEDGTVSGSVVVPVAGSLWVRFDNGHSRFAAKTLTFSLVVAPPPPEGAAPA